MSDLIFFQVYLTSFPHYLRYPQYPRKWNPLLNRTRFALNRGCEVWIFSREKFSPFHFRCSLVNWWREFQIFSWVSYNKVLSLSRSSIFFDELLKVKIFFFSEPLNTVATTYARTIKFRPSTLYWTNDITALNLWLVCCPVIVFKEE